MEMNELFYQDAYLKEFDAKVIRCTACKNGFDVVVPLQLKEYKYYATKEVEVKTDENGKETYTIKENRPTDKITPSVWKVTKEKSVYEAVKLASGGSLNWRSVMNLNKMYNPSTPTLKEVLKLE